MRAGLLPDTEALGDDSTVELDLIEETLDNIVAKSTFLPPSPFCDPMLALNEARKRWDKELTYGDTPKESFRALYQFCQALKDLIKAAPQPAGPPTGAPGQAPALSPQPPQ
jgi:hypothetical protein